MFCDSVENVARKKMFESMVRSKQTLIAVISDAPTLLVSSGLDDHVGMGTESLYCSVVNILNNDTGHIPTLTPPEDFEAIIIAQNQRDSILHRVTHSLYRVPDKERRAALKQGILDYLAGVSRHPPQTGMPVLDDVLASAAAKRLRDCCVATRSRHADVTSAEFGVDRFEVGYVIRSSVKTPSTLSNIEFRDE